MNNLLTIDGGTTNTRISLLSNEKIVDRIKLCIGAGTNSNGRLGSSLADGIDKILKRNSIATTDIPCIIASGMIGSELGLLQVPHITAPVDLNQLASSAVKKVFESITSIPFLFIPGVRNNSDSFDNEDFMRGEETEFFGLDDTMLQCDKLLAIFPGSHTKLIFSEKGQIICCHTTLLGEMLDSISKNTILKNTLTNGLAEEVDTEYLIKGYDFAMQHGLNQALFKVRVLGKSFNVSTDKLSSFYKGAVIHDDVKLIQSMADGHKIVLCGSSALKSVFKEILQYALHSDITVLGNEAEYLQVKGAIALYNAASK